MFQNITATMSDHLFQFLFVPNVLSNPICNKLNILQRVFLKFSKKILFLITLTKIGLKFSN